MNEPTHEMYMLPNVLRLLPKGPCRILEVGCGTGFATSSIASLGHSVIAVDTWKAGIDMARQAHPDIRFEVHSAYDDFTSLGANFDAVIAIEVIEHLQTPRRFLENAFNTLRPCGRIVLTTPYHGYIKNLALSLVGGWDKHFGVDWDDGHLKFFSERSLSAMLLQSGFDLPRFANAGRLPFLWKSLVCCAGRPSSQS